MKPLVSLVRLVAVVLLASGCYSRVPVVSSLPEPGARIIATITDRGIVDMTARIGAGAVEVEGEVASVDAAAWNLRLLRVDHRGGESVKWNREVVSFPREVLVNVTEKRLDKRRTWLTVGLTAAGAFIASKVFGSSSSTGEPGGGQPPPPEFRPGR